MAGLETIAYCLGLLALLALLGAIAKALGYREELEKREACWERQREQLERELAFVRRERDRFQAAMKKAQLELDRTKPPPKASPLNTLICGDAGCLTPETYAQKLREEATRRKAQEEKREARRLSRAKARYQDMLDSAAAYQAAVDADAPDYGNDAAAFLPSWEEFRDGECKDPLSDPEDPSDD